MGLTSKAKCSIISLLGLKPTSLGKAYKVGLQSLQRQCSSTLDMYV